MNTTHDEQETFADLQNDIMDAQAVLVRVEGSLRDAGSCETLADMTANTTDALDAAEQLVKALKRLKKMQFDATVAIGKRLSVEAKGAK
jgi:hypothetical protein